MPQSNHKIISIDGSIGEGGGQILRTSLALSCVLRLPVEIVNIRRARQKPGLQPQHLTAVNAAAAVCRAEVDGALLSSTAIRFLPDAVVGGDYYFDVSETKGSAGSALLVLQTILPPLCFADGPSTVTVVGGTHVPWSPTAQYLEQVFFPMLARIGADAGVFLDKWGWYPLGGGKLNARIRPGKEPLPLRVTERGMLVRVGGISAVSNLPREIAVRQRDRAVRTLSQKGIDAEIEIVNAPSPGKGTLVFLLAEFENVRSGFSALGAPGKRAEEVAEEACRYLFEYLDAGALLDPHLTDQLVHYLALARGASEFTTSRITKHLLTNIRVVQQFIECDIRVTGQEGEAGTVRIDPLRV
ncbi:MAG TPA: RNA 3'-terminal phosphate cyclase [Nitrospirota bacterium]|nr:RNA 3'-terminal phosphate cyclase [Nitrospirota bacterium]